MGTKEIKFSGKPMRQNVPQWREIYKDHIPVHQQDDHLTAGAWAGCGQSSLGNNSETEVIIIFL